MADKIDIELAKLIKAGFSYTEIITASRRKAETELKTKASEAHEKILAIRAELAQLAKILKLELPELSLAPDVYETVTGESVKGRRAPTTRKRTASHEVRSRVEPVFKAIKAAGAKGAAKRELREITGLDDVDAPVKELLEKNRVRMAGGRKTARYVAI